MLSGLSRAVRWTVIMNVPLLLASYRLELIESDTVIEPLGREPSIDVPAFRPVWRCQ